MALEGDLVLTVGGDLSPLEDTLNEVPAVAQHAAAGINDAMSGALDGATSSLTNLSSALSSTGSSASDATSGIDALKDSASQLDPVLQQITDDYTAQQQKLAEAQQYLAAVQDAYNSNAASAGQLADAAGKVSSAYDAINPGVQQFGENIRQSGQAAEEAEGHFSKTKETLIAMAEAFAIFEGMKEFAADALSVAAAVDSAQVSLTHFTGSTQLANEEIDHLEQMSMSEGLKFPQLLQASVNMQALGLNIAQTNTLMQISADASKAMGISLDSASQRIEAMVASGVLMTRSLSSMGISSNSLAEILGVSTSKMSAAFKGLDIDDRMLVIQLAFQKLGGVAVEQAQTIGGTWDRLAAQFHIVMDDIGHALEPTAMALLNFANNSILPYLKELVDWFKQLPAPVQDFAISLAALSASAAALVPTVGLLVLGFAGVSPELLAITGAVVLATAAIIAFAAAIPPDVVDNLKTAFTSVKEAVSAAADGIETAFNQAIASLGQFQSQSDSASTDTVNTWHIMADGIIGDAALIIDAAAALGAKMVELAIDFAKAVPTEAAALWDVVRGQLAAAWSGLVSAAEMLMSPISDLGSVLGSNGLIAQEFGNIWEAVKNEIVGLWHEIVAAFDAGIQGIIAVIPGAAGVLKQLQADMDNVGKSVNTAATSVHTYSSAVAAASPIQQMMNAEMQKFIQMAVQNAETIHNHTAAIKTDLAGVNNEANELNAALDAAATAMSGVHDQTALAASSYGQLMDDITISGAKLDPIEQRMAAIETQINAANASWAHLTDSEKQDVNVLQDIVDKYQQWDDIFKEANFSDKLNQISQSLLSAGSNVTRLDEKLQVLPGHIDLVKVGLDAIDAGITPVTEKTKAWDQALKDLGVTSDDVFRKSMGTELQEMNLLFNSGKLSTEQLDLAWESLSGKFKNSAEAQQQILDLLQAQGAPLQIQLSTYENILNDEIKRAQYTDMTGQSELQLTQQLTAAKLETWALHQETMGLSDTWNAVAKDAAAAFQGVGQAMATALISGQNFGQAMMKIVDQLAEKIVGTLIQKALNDLGAALIKSATDFNAVLGPSGIVATGLTDASKAFSNFGDQVGQVAHSAASVVDSSFSGMGKTVADFAATTTTSTQEAAQATTAAAVQMSASMTMILGLMTAIGAVVSAIASVIGAIEQAHTNTLLGRIEENTRRSDITLEGIVAQGQQAAIEYLPKLDNLYEIVGNTANMQATLDDISTGTNQLIDELTNLDSDLQTLNITAADMDLQLQMLVSSLGGGAGGSSGGGIDAAMSMMATSMASLDTHMLDVLQVLHEVDSLINNGFNAIGRLLSSTNDLLTQMLQASQAAVAALAHLPTTSSSAGSSSSSSALDLSSISTSVPATAITAASTDLSAAASTIVDTNTTLSSAVTAASSSLSASSSSLNSASTALGNATANVVVLPDMIAQVFANNQAGVAGIAPGARVIAQSTYDAVQAAIKAGGTVFNPLGTTESAVANELDMNALMTSPQAAAQQKARNDALQATVDQWNAVAAAGGQVATAVEGATDQTQAYTTAEQAAAAAMGDVTFHAGGITAQFDRFNNGFLNLTQATSDSVAVLTEQNALFGDLTSTIASGLIPAIQNTGMTLQQMQANLRATGNEGDSGAANPATVAAQQFLAYQQSLAQQMSSYGPMSTSPQITVNVQAGVVAGSGGMNELANTVGNTIVNNLRRAGLKF